MGHLLLRWIGDEAVMNAWVAGFSVYWLIGIIGVCVALLSRGADWLVAGVVQLANRTGLPKIVIGATIVSLGTTTPEAFVSVMAAVMGNPGLSLGNGVGSIIVDTGLIFGLTCLMARVPMNRFILNRTGWVQVGSATLLVLIGTGTLLASSGEPVLQRWVGVLLLTLLAIYMYITYRWAMELDTALRGEGVRPETLERKGRPTEWWVSVVLIIMGLVLVVGSARVMVPCASQIASRLGVPDDVIAATLVALGTSLPELVTAITAVRRGHPEITVGNIVGADVLNCLFVIGASAAARPLAIPSNFFYFHFPAMLLILYSFRVFISLNKDGHFKRWQGAWLLGVYLVYTLLQYTMNLGVEAH